VKKIKVESSDETVQAQFQMKVDPEVVPVAFAEAVQKVRNAANQAATKSNLRQIGIAFNNHDAQMTYLPEPAICSKDGKPLLSWRVAILPYIEQENLYEQFKLDEPWDSEHNKKLLDKMPRIYASPGVELKDKSLTYYKVFTGKNAMFQQGRKMTLAKISDLGGCACTIAAIEAGDPVPWTKPEDIAFDPDKPLPKLVGPYKNVLNICLGDGHVIGLPKDFSEKRLKSAIDINVGCQDGFGDEPKGSKEREERPRR
jgi:hypothetical protein